jgi:hypothetical protein
MMLIARSDRRRHDARSIAVDIADDQIELRHRTTQLLRMSQSLPSGEAPTPPFGIGMAYSAKSCLD